MKSMAAESPIIENVTETLCKNCGTTLVGRFCSKCGQPEKHLDPSFHDLLHELVHEFAHLDGKIVATLKALILKPGKLSTEFFAGRRASYIGPIRLYLTFSVVFFLVFALEPAKSPLTQVHGKSASREEVIKVIDEEMHKPGFEPNSFYGHLMRSALKASEDPELARHNFLTNA